MTLLLLYLLLAIGVSFICSISEAVLLSIRPAYIATLDPGTRTAKTLNKLTTNMDRPLAAILTANTIAHTVGAAGVGAQATLVFGNQYLGLTSAVLTFLILVFSEIIPKTLGATYWKALAPTVGPIINGMAIVLHPLVWCSEKLTRFLSRSEKTAFTFSREEMKAMIKIGRDEGVLDHKEHEIVSNLIKLKKLSVRDIMTPRTVIFSAPGDMTVHEFFLSHAQSAFSRIPVFDKTVDDIFGYILKTDLLIAQARDEFERPLRDFKREFLAVPKHVNASETYDRLMREKAHIALVVDEYGAVQGVVTLEDVVETLIGLEITDEMDKIEDMQLLARDRWRERMRQMKVDPTDLSGEDQEG